MASIQDTDKIQSALYRIAELAGAAQDMQEFYAAVHAIVGELMYAENFFISLYDEERQLVNWPYYRDSIDLDLPDPNKWDAVGTGDARGVTAWMLRTGKPQLVPYERFVELLEQKEVELRGAVTGQATWVGVPLHAEGKAVGALVVQSYTAKHRYSEQDRDLLAFVGQHVGGALSRARAIEETRQRNAELALINTVQSALAGELELQAIYDVVGDKIQEVFDAQVVDIGIFEEASGLIHFPYTIERGVRFPDEPIELIGFRKHAMETGEPLMIAESSPEVAESYGNPFVLSGEPVRSALFVPLVVGSRATGVISLQNLDREHAFTDADQRLLTTLAGSLSVALENARLVHETRQRNAELALINSVQDALAGELELQAIYDVVGDKIQEIFDAQVVDIGILDETDGLIHFPYSIERGVRFPDEPSPISATMKLLFDSKAPVLINDLPAWDRQRGEVSPVIQGERPLSVLAAPLFSGEDVRGRVSLQNLDRTNAFSESDVRLLTTLTASLSVALENARLVHETRQRNAELALINSVQQAIAGELDSQAIYELVGDRIRDVFDAQGVLILMLDEATGHVVVPYARERGEPIDMPPRTPSGYTKHVLETREPVMILEDVTGETKRRGIDSPVAGEEPKSILFVPLIAGGNPTGVISLQNADREHAFTESDQRLLTTLAGSLSVALENARLVHETRQRNAELATINSVQESIAGELDLQTIYDLVGEKLREVFDAQVVDIAVHDEDAGLMRFVYQIERGVHFPNITFPVMGFRRHVMDTREPLAIHENMDSALVQYGNPVAIVGEASKGSAIFQPLVVGSRATGVISIQNLDREHAFSASDQQVLGTIAGSLGVALENAQLIQETRQRVAELGTVNSVGQALASQLDLDALIDLVGDRIRETFDADIAYVALHDEATGLIEFPYTWEAGERRDEEPLKYGQGLTSRIIESGEPLLIDATREGRTAIGTPAKSYLGVPVWAGDSPIGVISVQSTTEEGRYGEADIRLLSTLAANIGAAIQNARLFAEIARQKQYFESLVGISPVAVIEMDADERVTGWNPAAEELFGYSPEEAIGRQIDYLVFDEEHREEGREITEEAVTAGRAHRITRRARKDGTLVDVELMLVPLTVDGEREGFLGIYHDISELQQAREEAEAATQAKSAFLATMSHEIRTPMNAVIGMTGLLLGTELTQEQREFAEVVGSSGDALLHVIDDILDYSKIEAGKLELEREPFDLRMCVEEALDIVAPRAAEKSLEIGALVGEGVPAAIAGDAARLRQVLLNLLSNAVKFTEAGEVVVDLDAEPARSGSSRVHLTVRDTGIGIPPDRIDHLFESFSQGDASTTRRYGGTGLGLAISKRLVELMGGRLWVETQEGEGSAFHIEFEAEEAQVPKRAPFDGTQPQLAGKRLLVVDDNATNREIVSRQAQSWGMEALAFESPSEALALIEAGEHFDVAVLDLVMPEMDGRELAREIQRHRSARELPLLLVTSLGRLPQAREADGFAAQLAKPLKASQLYDALMRVFADRDDDRQTPSADEAAAEVSPLRILLAEDSAVNQKVALALLAKLGYRADVVGNGREALAALEQDRYDVVLMDVQMPELDGLDTTRRIHERWPPAERPRIVAMTANAMQEDRDACFAAGMDDYVAKPIRPEALAEALRQARPLTSA